MAFYARENRRTVSYRVVTAYDSLDIGASENAHRVAFDKLQ